MALAITISSGYIVDNTQKKIIISGNLTVTGTGNYPAGGILGLDAAVLALPEAQTNSGIKRITLQSNNGTGYIYQRISSTGALMILQVPPAGSLTTAAPLQQIPSSTNMQGVQNDSIGFVAEMLRNS